jgi:outer membrane receptor protein involved in Fe transport
VNLSSKIFLVQLLFYHLLVAGTTGKIKGTIINSETNEPIIGANVFLEETIFGSVSDENGQYFILNVPPGSYTIRVSYIGYTPERVINVLVYSDRTTRKDFILKTLVLEGDEITVEAERSLIEKDRTNSASYTSSSEIEMMAVQEVEDIIQLQAGVVKDAGGKLHMRGGRHGEISYLIDGITVSDQFRGGAAVDVQNNWIQELQVISGSFNAEYGQAQSGVINVVTKEGSDDFGGSVSISTGSHVSNNNDIFYNINNSKIKEIDINTDFDGPIPFINRGSYLFSIRNYNSEGWLYGINRFKPEDTVPIQEFIQFAQNNMTDEERLIGIKIPDSLQTGDNSYVPLNNVQKLSYFGKISFYPMKKLKFSYSMIYNSQNGKSYSNYRRYSPQGVANNYINNYNHIFKINHMLSNKTFYTVSYSSYHKKSEKKLYENPLDNRYQGTPFSTNGFAFGGTDNSRSDVSNKSNTLKVDFSSQIDYFNQIKMGIEYKWHELNYYSLSTVTSGPVSQIPVLSIPEVNTSLQNTYQKTPFEASVYIQDKMEFNEFIINAGLRYDYWDSRSVIPSDPRATTKPDDGIRLDTDFNPSEAMTQLSPRFGMAYSFSDNGVVHASYGHFFQIPKLSYIFSNSEFEVELGGLQTVMGNANLKPEKTVTFELGLQQELNNLVAINLAIYNKTIRNLLSQEIISTYDEKVYARYINRDYGNVRGITASLEKKSSLLSWGVDYTYQIAKGNASDPNAVFVDFQSNPPKESEKQVVPLDWDQRHTINTITSFSLPTKWNISVVGKFSTGQPYTPTNPGSQLTTQFENSSVKPETYTIDLNINKLFSIRKTKFQVYTKIFNLFDRINQVSVYSSTGSAENPYRSYVENELLNLNPNLSIQEINLRPNYYGEPRKIIIGIKTKI